LLLGRDLYDHRVGRVLVGFNMESTELIVVDHLPLFGSKSGKPNSTNKVPGIDWVNSLSDSGHLADSPSGSDRGGFHRNGNTKLESVDCHGSVNLFSKLLKNVNELFVLPRFREADSELRKHSLHSGDAYTDPPVFIHDLSGRSEERRVGKERSVR